MTGSRNLASSARAFAKVRSGLPRILFAASAILVACLLATKLIAPQSSQSRPLQPDSKRAYEYLLKVCRIGPRISGTDGMAQQQKLIADHFSQFDAQVRFQAFDAAHPLNGSAVRMNNMIVSWNQEATERVLLACHYDTRPLPDRDLFNPRGTFVGANDGASGVALLMELAHHMPNLKSKYGVDFVFFDGEELIYGQQGTYFLGSDCFAKN